MSGGLLVTVPLIVALFFLLVPVSNLMSSGLKTLYVCVVEYNFLHMVKMFCVCTVQCGSQ